MSSELERPVAAKPCELQTNKNGKATFFVRPCFDVFFEELSFGNRRQLAKLESVGRRFRVVIDQKVGVKPFLRLNLTCDPSAAYISTSQIDAVLPEPTPFLRFDVVNLNYRPGQQPIAAKCESVKKLLLPLKLALIGAKLEFDGRIDQNDLSDFSDHSTLLAHLTNDLLPNCNGFSAYEFCMSFLSEENAPTVISSILEMGPVSDCRNVKFVILGIDQPTHLPVESITNWFFHNVAEERKRNIRENKSVEIRMDGISNGAEIQTHLKEANYGHKEFCAAFSFGDLCFMDRIKSVGDRIKADDDRINAQIDRMKAHGDQIKSVGDEIKSLKGF